MSPMKTLLAAATAALLSVPAFAGDLMINDAYARAAGAKATAGAAFFEIMNQGDSDDRLIDARSPVAKRVELHTHKENDQGVMQMLHVPEGFPVAAGETHLLKRGGDHVMFMGLNTPFEDGATVPLTLVFEKAGEITLEVPVDLQRKPGGGAMQMDNANMGGGMTTTPEATPAN